MEPKRWLVVPRVNRERENKKVEQDGHQVSKPFNFNNYEQNKI